ncbi:hypothetical protein, partial [Mycobacterium kiyosense]|uniref:hypothetical protein n=1 Tax=Mycobacterium kiyosense TaxID=2871094 RepID=UPI0022311C01
MDVVLGVAVTGRVARLALVDAVARGGEVIDQYSVDLAGDPVADLSETVVGTHRLLSDEGHRLLATELCWPDRYGAERLTQALSYAGVPNVHLVPPSEAARRPVGPGRAAAVALLFGNQMASPAASGDPDAPPTMFASAPPDSNFAADATMASPVVSSDATMAAPALGGDGGYGSAGGGWPPGSGVDQSVPPGDGGGFGSAGATMAQPVLPGDGGAAPAGWGPSGSGVDQSALPGDGGAAGSAGGWGPSGSGVDQSPLAGDGGAGSAGGWAPADSGVDKSALPGDGGSGSAGGGGYGSPIENPHLPPDHGGFSPAGSTVAQPALPADATMAAPSLGDATMAAPISGDGGGANFHSGVSSGDPGVGGDPHAHAYLHSGVASGDPGAPGDATAFLPPADGGASSSGDEQLAYSQASEYDILPVDTDGFGEYGDEYADGYEDEFDDGFDEDDPDAGGSPHNLKRLLISNAVAAFAVMGFASLAVAVAVTVRPAAASTPVEGHQNAQPGKFMPLLPTEQQAPVPPPAPEAPTVGFQGGSIPPVQNIPTQAPVPAAPAPVPNAPAPVPNAPAPVPVPIPLPIPFPGWVPGMPTWPTYTPPTYPTPFTPPTTPYTTPATTPATTAPTTPPTTAPTTPPSTAPKTAAPTTPPTTAAPRVST